jgi:hypothetical protein
VKLHAVLAVAVLAAAASSVSTPALLAQTAPPASIVGTWTLNKDKSDQPPNEANRTGDDGGRDDGRHAGSGGRGGHGGGFGGGGARGGFGGGPGGPGGGRGNEQEMQRRREALRTILEAPERRTITRTDTMVIVTTGDGRTTRLATDGSKVKDESTGFEQRTHWEGDRLITEFTGSGRGKIVQTYAVDPQARELVVTVQMEGGSNSQRGAENKAPQGTQKRVYELTPQ